ncbi:MAG: extracellular solute-binding protein [Ruminococcus sp.]|uniref:extracellular solute-binding protein n=1 Tax=Ruminococcus sp. TaxID=41978 RepID=UPI0025D8C249|nr:extracellular solute-binding protein [Ruminococcus sp.]MCR4795088.1 extracellular solute-binding protein [Ruminococcus sp.]
MDTTRKTLAVILSLAMLAPVTSCGSKKEPAVKPLSSKGGYVEKSLRNSDTGLNQYASEFTTIGEKTGVFVPSPPELMYISKDGTRVFFSEDEHIDQNNNDDIYNVIAASEKGFLLNKVDGTYVINPDGKSSKVEGIEFYVFNAEFTENGRLFAESRVHLYEIDVNTGAAKKLGDINGDNVYFFDIIGDKIIYGDGDGTHIYDIEKECETEVPEVLAELLDKYNSSEIGNVLDICEGNDDDIYIACADGVYHYSWGGNYVEQIIDGLVSRFGDPSETLGSIYYSDDGVIYAVFDSGMYSYTYDPELENAVTSELKVYSLEKNDSISQIVSSFAANNRNVKVDYQVGMKDGITYSDAVKALTTQIMSGNAPDVIVLDGLDNENLIEKNMLMDLSECEDKWLPEGGIIENVAKWNTKDDKLYSVACKFRIPVIGAEKKELDNIKSFADAADLCEKYRKNDDPKYTIMDFLEETDPIRMGLMYEGNKLLSGTPDKAAFEKFYESCEKLYNNDKSEDEMAYATIVDSEDADPISEYFFGTRFMCTKTSKDCIALGAMNGFEKDLNIVLSMRKSKSGIDADYRYGMENDKSFVPNCNIAVSGACKNKEEAFRFIASALGEKSQEISHSDGFPVNKAALEWFYEKNDNKDNDYMVMRSSLDSDDPNVGDEYEIKWISDEEAEEFNDYIQTLNEPVFIKYSVRDIIETAGKKCIEGAVTAEQAAEDTVKQLELRMKE